MNTYTVKEISGILKTNPETVRRWIRSGKLSTQKTSNKRGNIVSQEALNQFIKSRPKYANSLTGSIVNSSVALSLVVGGLIGGIIGSLIIGDKKKLGRDDIRKSIENQIASCEKRISANKKHLSEIKSRIEEDENSLQQLKYALDNLDLDLIAKEINNEKK